MGKCKKYKKIAYMVSIILCIAILFTSVDSLAFSKIRGIDATNNLCEHHTEHTLECGYSEGTEGVPCSHEHTEQCRETRTDCIHRHEKECYVTNTGTDTATYTETNTETDTENIELGEPTECTHVCTKENWRPWTQQNWQRSRKR